MIQAFSAVLKARRLELGMTQEDLAGAIELDRPYITMLEAGRKQPTLSVLWRIAAGLQFSAGELATRVDEQLALARRLRPTSQPGQERGH
ncbi:MAG: helix-turn-helix domain-containing protein [Betaproteobacteria bacterium]